MKTPKTAADNSRKLRLVYSAPSDGSMFGAGTNVPPRMLQCPTDKMAELEKSDARIMEPEQMVAEVNAYHRVKLIAEQEIEAEEGDQNWSVWIDADFESCVEMAEFVEENDTDTDGDVETWMCWLDAKLGDKFGSTIESMTVKQSDRLVDFFIAPNTFPLPAKHPIRKIFPCIVEAAERQRKVRRILIAQACLQQQKEPYVYWGMMTPPPERDPQNIHFPKWVKFEDRYPGRFQGQQEIWCFFDPCYDGDIGGETDQFFYQYSAVWVDVNPQGIGKLVASAAGYYIPLWGGEHSIGEECFTEVCYENFGLLSRLPEVVIGQFLPSEGVPTLQHFSELCWDFGIGWPGIALVCVEVSGDQGPKHRFEHDILEDFFYNLTSVLDEGFGQCYSNPKMQRPPFPDESEELEIGEEDDPFEHLGPSQSPIRLFVVPVTGEPSTTTSGMGALDPEMTAQRAFDQARRLRKCDQNAKHGFYVRTMFTEKFSE